MKKLKWTFDQRLDDILDKIAAVGAAVVTFLIILAVVLGTMTMLVGCKKTTTEWRGLPAGAICEGNRGAGYTCVKDGRAYLCVTARDGHAECAPMTVIAPPLSEAG